MNFVRKSFRKLSYQIRRDVQTDNKCVYWVLQVATTVQLDIFKHCLRWLRHLHCSATDILQVSWWEPYPWSQMETGKRAQQMWCKTLLFLCESSEPLKQSATVSSSSQLCQLLREPAWQVKNPLAAKKRQDLTSVDICRITVVQPHQVRYQVRYQVRQ